ncbi:MAG TPA: hypothetical protein VKI18_02465 [Albitalea sp.]|nr:hypothetical protein [Albitalea sp.]
MLEMLRAHGLVAGPTQRPWLAGAAAGAVADLPALALLAGFGTLAKLAAAAGASLPTVALLHGGAMVVGGVLYGLLFQRAANDAAGGWLFGIAYGFLLWLVAAVPLLQWLAPKPVVVGLPAIGLFLGQLLWGLVLGLTFKYIHRPLQSGLDGQIPSAAGDARAR